MSRRQDNAGTAKASTTLFRWFRIALGAVLLLLLVAAGSVYAMSERILRERHEVDAPPFAHTLPSDPAALAEGERLARIRGCQGCHGEDLTGRVFLSEPGVAELIAPNLTALVPQRTDQELERALRHGIRTDGTSLFVMPAEMLRSLHDDDMARLLAWLRSLPETDGDSRGRRIGPLGRLGIVLGQFRSSVFYIETETVLPVPADASLELGHYIATSSCTECHGNTMHGFDDTPSLVGMAIAYSPEAWAEFLRTGTAIGNRELPMMSGVARSRFSHLTADEVDGLHLYLRSLAGQKED